MPNWYDDSFFILHYDHHYSLNDIPVPISGFDPDQVRRHLEAVRPDVVQYYAKGHPGLVPYPTLYANQLYTIPDHSPDLLLAYREITRELGIRFVIAYSGLVDYQAANNRPDWLRVRSDGQPYQPRVLCPNTGYVEELLLLQLGELLERYAPDGLWIDAENWTVSPCYCTFCESEYQMMKSRSAPLDRRDPYWSDWLEFHRTSFQRYLTRVARFVHEATPDVVYASNAAFCTHQPEALPGVLGAEPDRLTWDLSPAYAVRQASLEARFLTRQGVPFDLMTWNQCSARPWARGRLPALPAYPKSFEHLAQEGAAILANGGRWSVWVSAYRDDALPDSQLEVLAQAAEFARERQPWSHGTESGAYVAVLHSAATHAEAGNGLYDPGPSLDRVRGAHQALLELHHPHDIVNEETLLAHLDEYQVIVLPEQTALPATLDVPLLAWVERGGRLVASGRVAPRVIEDVPTFSLEEALGVRWTGRQADGGWFRRGNLPLQVPGPVYDVALAGAETVLPLLQSGHEALQNPTGYSAVTRNGYGQGEAYYIAADLFTAFHRSQYPALRDLVGDVLELALPVPSIQTTAPPTIEIALRARGDETIFHFVNHAPGKSLAQNNAFVESVPPSPPFSITLQVLEQPAAVRLQPGDIEPEWSAAEQAVTVFVPPVHLHTALVFTLPPVADTTEEPATVDE